MTGHNVVGVPLHYMKQRTMNIKQVRPEDLSSQELIRLIAKDPKDQHLVDELFRRSNGISRR